MSNVKKGFKGSINRLFIEDTNKDVSNVNSNAPASLKDTVSPTQQENPIDKKGLKVYKKKGAKVDSVKEAITPAEEIKPKREKQEEKQSTNGKAQQKQQEDLEELEEQKFVKITVEVNAKYAELISREVFWERTTMKAIFDEELTNRYHKQSFDAIPVNKKPTKRGPKPKK